MGGGVEGEVLKLHRAAVEPHKVAGLAVYGGKLVHNTAVHTAVVVLGRLADASQSEAVDTQLIEVVESKCKGALQGSRRTHTCTQGHVATEHGVETTNGVAPLLNLAAHAKEVASPLCGGFVLLVQTKFAALAEVQCIGLNFVGAIEADGSNNTFVNCAGEYEATIVVGVLANEVDAAGRSKENCTLAIEFFELL